MLIIKHIAILVVFFSSVTVFAVWKQVPLNDKSDFDINCEYRAELENKIVPLRTRFTSTLNKKIGYAPVSVYGGVMSNNKAILQIEAPSGAVVKKITVIKLEKRCMLPTVNADDKQKLDEIVDSTKVSRQFNFSKTHPGANFGLDDAAYNE